MTKEAMIFKDCHTPLSMQVLDELNSKGFKYVQVKGFNGDYEQDYVEPGRIVLVPMKELPEDERKKDIYEPVSNDLLIRMATEEEDNRGFTQVFIADVPWRSTAGKITT